MAAATPISLARTLSEQRVDAKAMAALLRDADQRAAAGAPVPMLPRRAATVSRETTKRPPALAPRRMRSDVARAPQLPGGDQDDDTFDANTEFDERLMPRRNTSAAHCRATSLLRTTASCFGGRRRMTIRKASADFAARAPHTLVRAASCRANTSRAPPASWRSGHPVAVRERLALHARMAAARRLSRL